MPPIHSAGRFPIRAAAGALLFIACTLAATAAPEVVIFKDGFMIQGNVRKEQQKVNDPFAKSVTILKADGLDFIDDGARMTIYSTHSRQPGETSVLLRPEYKSYTMPLGRHNTHPLPAMIGAKDMPNFDAKWKRTLKVTLPGNDWEKIEQKITYLDPYCCYISSPSHLWTQVYRTAEMNPKEVRKLLSTHPELAEADGKPDPMKRIAIAKFMKDAGWLASATEEIANLKKAVPMPLAKEAQEKLDALQKEVDRAAAALVVSEAELALASGRYEQTAKWLALFPEKSADPTDVDRITKIMAQSKTAREHYDTARRMLRTLIDETTGLGAAQPFLAAGGGPFVAVWPNKGGNPQLQILATAAEEIYASLHPDSAGRLEIFVQLALQPNRKEPEKLLAAAISGWVMGKNNTTEDYARALKLWHTRTMVLDYQRCGTLNERNTVLGQYKKEANPLSLDVLTQIISLLPPAEPEDLRNRTGTLVKAGNGVPEGIYKRRSAPYGQHPAGLDYFIKLPPEYHHGRAYPVIVALAEPGIEAEKFIGSIEREADKYGYIVIAPDWAPPFSGVKAWTWDGADHDFVTAALRDAIRHFTVDNDRVMMIGGGAGADLAMDIGASHPDLFAGVVAVGPNPHWGGHFENYWKNCQKLPFYVVNGDLAASNAVLRRIYAPWTRHGFPSLHVMFRGRGSEWFGVETPVYFDWLSRKKRVAPTALLNLGTNFGRYMFQTMREEDNHFYWLGADKIHPGNLSPNGKPDQRIQPAHFLADVRGNNLIDIKAQGVRQVSVWLGRDMIDWSRPVKVSMNGVLATGWKQGGKMVQQDIDVLLEDFWQRGDRRMLYLARLEFPNNQ